ncbi:ferredoxin/flavodoxin [Sedimentibacter acidaminivorans]|jgi:ferredoxin/flavodoxin|uniref:Ferredoxin/flavodoxin n=1 Tax=Sedimentibacter acidaminivorans TaxID=913099 RepID=A0ABS4GAM3_9FIRM|nr:EFR1 family ferrodoxin [Sedimentibacter acidaminivorans]MBP1924734.1 ferredoxin/flavodoxin [Sedimentibacter acidaminivorans]
MNYRINAMYFSPTGTTKKVVSGIAENILENSNLENRINYIDFTSFENRTEEVLFKEGDLLIIGVPVYAGRVPNVLLKYLDKLKSSGSLAVPVVVYGNRNYDDALIELKSILESNGFNVIAAAAFIGEHSFSYTLGKGRPDDKDMDIINHFSDIINSILSSGKCNEYLEVSGHMPLRPYYMPKDNMGNPVDIRKVTPKTKDICNDCKLCVKVCPMGAIDINDIHKLNGICIKCGACIKMCPLKAKFFDDIGYLKHKEELEIKFAVRREPELFFR